MKNGGGATNNSQKVTPDQLLELRRKRRRKSFGQALKAYIKSAAKAKTKEKPSEQKLKQALQRNLRQKYVRAQLKWLRIEGMSRKMHRRPV